MSNFVRAIVLVILVFGPRAGRAQERITLTLERTIQIAADNSPASRMARLQFRQSDLEYQAFRAGYLPSISLSGEAPGLERSISDILQDDGSVRYVSQSRTFSRVGLSIVQPIAFTGGQVFVSSGLSRVNLFGEQSSNQWQSSPLVVGLIQPLFQFNELAWNRELEPLRFRASQRRFAENMAEVAVNVAQHFFDVVISQLGVDRAEYNVAVNDTIYTLSEGRYDIGRIAENDLLESELALLNARTDLSDRRIEYNRAVQDLKIALGISSDAEIHVIPPFEAPHLEIEAEAAVERARRNRSAFLEFEIDELEAEREVASVRSESGITADLTASYGLNQSSERLGEAYESPLNRQRFTVGFTVPIYHWGRSRALVQSAIAERKRVEESVELRRKELEQDVYFEALRTNQLRQQLDIAAAADTIAARRFEVARNRYSIGNIDITDLFIAQQAKDQANEAYMRTLEEFWMSYFHLRQMTLYDFANGRSLIER